MEADHRRHAEAEEVIHDLKEEAGPAHLPSGPFAADAARSAPPPDYPLRYGPRQLATGFSLRVIALLNLV